jgi:hypothetical protein
MAATNIDEIFKQIEKDFVELSKDAARSAANKAQKDIGQKADKFIDEYYQYKPKIYKKRQYALYKLVQRYYKESTTAKGMAIEFGVKYNASKIKGIHKSSSPLHQSGQKWISRDSSGFRWDSGDNGIPEPEWITNKFLEGEHPWAQIDDQSPDEKMQYFFDTELTDLIGNYMNDALMDAVAAYF